MRIATCINASGGISTPFDASAIHVYEQTVSGWARVRDLAYFPVPDMGISHARALLRGLTSQLTDCEIFLVSEMQGFTHVWLGEFGFRTWMSEGALYEQLDKVASEDEKAQELKRKNPQSYNAQSCASSCGGGCAPAQGTASASSCGTDCRGDSAHSIEGSDDTLAKILAPLQVGESIDCHFQIDLANILELYPVLNSRQVLLPVLEKREFLVLDAHFDHLPRWFTRTLEENNLEATLTDSLPPARGISARITRSSHE